IAPNSNLVVRVVIITLKSPFIRKLTVEILQITGLLIRTINLIYIYAVKVGFKPNSL
ncbi:hypothetical protein LZ30DRAFT_540530, partial [Colletotrichum cereale]